MKIAKRAVAGTLESSDVLITVEDNVARGITIKLESEVEKQFGKQIQDVAEGVLKDFEVNDAVVTIIDKGALNCTIQARMEVALMRATECSEFSWGRQ